jgi:hypothetical protein
MTTIIIIVGILWFLGALSGGLTGWTNEPKL